MKKIKISKKEIKEARKELKSTPKFSQLKTLNILPRLTVCLTWLCILAYAFFMLFFILLFFWWIICPNIKTWELNFVMNLPFALSIGALITSVVMIILIICSVKSTSEVVAQIKCGEWNAYEVFRYNYLVRKVRKTSKIFILIGVILFALPLASIPTSIVLLLTDIFSYDLTNKIFYAGIEQASKEGILTPEEVQYYNINRPDFFEELTISSQIYNRVETFYSPKPLAENKD